MSTGGTDDTVSVDVDIRDGRTVLTVSGTRDAAVIVRSASGEEIYLPPENFDDRSGGAVGGSETPYGSASPGDSPYETSPPVDSPYQGLNTGTSPYESGETGREGGSDAEGHESATPVLGTRSTEDGFRIVHPEPVTDMRLVR